MRQELQDELYAKYPNIFAQKDLPITQSCMGWGINVGDGWYKIIDELCQKIQDHTLEVKRTYKKFNPQASQVKEKFGVLRFYIDGADEYIYNLIDEATAKSAKTCDVCGADGHCASYRRWWVTLCKEHSAEYIAKSGHSIDEVYYDEELPEDFDDSETT